VRNASFLAQSVHQAGIWHLAFWSKDIRPSAIPFVLASFRATRKTMRLASVVLSE
jgi:hypothetical protein